MWRKNRSERAQVDLSVSVSTNRSKYAMRMDGTSEDLLLVHHCLTDLRREFTAK